MDDDQKRKAEDILSSFEHPDNTPVTDGQKLLAERIKNMVASSGNETLSPGKKESIWNQIRTHIPHTLTRPEKTRVIRIRRWAAAAASVLVLLSFGVYLRLHQPASPDKQVVKRTTHTAKTDIVPGSNKAVLTLADGSSIVLDSAKNGLLTQEGETRISKTAQGQIAYNSNARPDAPLQINTISTPRGGQYQIILPDGTKAWLNAASSLRFPTAFTGTERNVQITGEVYFEVAKNKLMPFKVSVNSSIVEVLGTHFNIKAYDDEKEMKTTLLEGSVKVSNNAAPVFLRPGQQASVNYQSGMIRVQPVNLDVAIAWKKGIFNFKSENIKSIMRDLSRWYDVDIVYKGDFEDADFSGGISRFKNISEVLTLLELTDDVHFKVEGRRVTVMR